MGLFPGDDPVVIACLEKWPVLLPHLEAWCGSEDVLRPATSLSGAAEAIDGDVDVVMVGAGWAKPMVAGWIRARPFLGPLAIVVEDEHLLDHREFLPVDRILTAPVDRETIHVTVEDLLLNERSYRYKLEMLELLSRKAELERRLLETELAADIAYQLITEELELMLDRTGMRVVPISSKYRPRSCSNCGLRWDVRVDDTVGFVPLSSFSWKCVGCGELTPNVNPFDRSVARR